MKTLNEIKNQSEKEKLDILSLFVKENGREDFGVDTRALNSLFEDAVEKSDFATPYTEEEGFKLYEVEVEYFGKFDGKNGIPAHITVYVGDKFDEEKGVCETYFAL